MLETQFTADTTDLLTAMVQIKRLQKKYFEKGICKIRTMPGGIEISTVGMMNFVHAETENICEVIAPLKIIYAYVAECKTPTLYFKFTDRTMQCGSVTCVTPEIKIQQWVDQPTLDFSIDYTDMELLRLYFTEGDSKIVNPAMLTRLKTAKMKLNKAITEAHGSLSAYSVKREDVESIVKSRIINRLPH